MELFETDAAEVRQMPAKQDPKRLAEIAARKLASLGLRTRFHDDGRRVYTAVPLDDPTLEQPWLEKPLDKALLENVGHDRLKIAAPAFFEDLEPFFFYDFKQGDRVRRKAADLVRGRLRRIDDMLARLEEMNLPGKVSPEDLSIRTVMTAGPNRLEAEVALDGTITLRRVGKTEIEDAALLKKGTVRLDAFASGFDLELDLGHKAAVIEKEIRGREGRSAGGEAAKVDESEFLTRDDSVLDEIYNRSNEASIEADGDGSPESPESPPPPLTDSSAPSSASKKRRAKMPEKVGAYSYYRLEEIAERFGRETTLMIKGDLQLSSTVRVGGEPVTLVLRALSRDRYAGQARDPDGRGRRVEFLFDEEGLTAAGILELKKRGN